MTGEGGRSAHLARILLLVALVTINATLITLNLDKHRLLWFQSAAQDADSVSPDPVGLSPPDDSVDAPNAQNSAAGEPAVSGGLVAGDPFQARGGVPNGPAAPRLVLLRADGRATVVGSAPSGAVAAAITDAVAEALAPEAASVDEDLIWHPAAADQSSGGVVVLDPPVLYPAGEVAVPPAATGDLDFVASVLSDRIRAFVVVTGHIDDLGDSEENVAVAAARVSAVVGYLESQGIARSRLVSAVAPINLDGPPNETDEERAFNRRVEVRFENLLGLQPPTPPSSAEESAAVLWSIDSALVAGFDCAEPVQGQPLRIGYAADFSPLGAMADVPGSEAVKHLASLVNCSGGVRGRPVDVAVFDVGGNAETTRRAIGELLAWEPAAIIGPRSAGPGLRLIGAVAGRVPVVFAASTEPALADASRGSFLTTSDGGTLADVAARFANDNGWRSAVTFSSPGPDYGFDPAAFAVELAADGGTVLSEFEYPAPSSAAEAQAGFADAVAQLASGPTPDVILTSMPTEHLAGLRREAAAAGLETNWITTNPMAPAGLATEVEGDGGDAADLEGLYLLGVIPSESDGRVDRLDRSFRTATGFGATNPTAAALAADAMTVIIEAYLRGGGGGSSAAEGDSATIIRALSAGLSVDAVGGRIHYSGSGNPARTIHVERVVDGELEPITSFDP